MFFNSARILDTKNVLRFGKLVQFYQLLFMTRNFVDEPVAASVNMFQ